MNTVKEKIEQVKLLLEEIKSELNPLLNNANKIDKQVQLDAVVKIAHKFDKISTELPSEIRSLKFKLIQEIDQFKEAEKLNHLLSNTLLPYINQKPTKSRKKPSSTSKAAPVQLGVKLIDLLDNNIIEPNTKIYKNIANQEYEATILPNGKIQLEHNNETLVFNSLSSAAKKLMERPINGWVWWEIEDNFGSRRVVDYYRQIFIRNGK